MERQESKLMGNVMKEFLDEYGLKGGIEYAQICRAYDLVVGKGISKYTSKISFRSGVLVCKISSSVIRAQLSFDADSIKERINEKVGSPVVKEIRFS